MTDGTGIGTATPRTVSVVLFDGFELLDVFGPVEILSVLPKQFAVTMVAPEAGLVASSQGTRVEATESLNTAPQADIVMLPGGAGSRRLVEDNGFLDQLRSFSSGAKLVTSVCTGSGVLAAAGLLDGYRATSNKLAFDWAAAQSNSVTWERRARWVHDRDRWTSSGVAAGIDMTAALIADLTDSDTARRAANLIEYQPQSDPDDDPFARIHPGS
jgi:putative intracellular protease/amidase